MASLAKTATPLKNPAEGPLPQPKVCENSEIFKAFWNAIRKKSHRLQGNLIPEDQFYQAIFPW